jgi:hypothetical protein
VLNRHKVAKHFILTITDEAFAFTRDTDASAKCALRPRCATFDAD